jgi:hypothetical protein
MILRCLKLRRGNRVPNEMGREMIEGKEHFL